ncbi:MAG: hypothetical protein H7Z11_05895 [Verrucomicrobia bacterium]|nr:hypothetical protein [Leptolyngbya sp. ES-bin-22]
MATNLNSMPAISSNIFDSLDHDIERMMGEEVLAFVSYVCITRSIADNDFGTLPSSTIAALRKLSGFLRRHPCDIEFFSQNGNVQNLAAITPETQILNTYPFTGETTLYGVINRVGGAKPKIQFKAFDGQLLYTTQEIAEQAGNRLYKQVGLEGRAEWNSETLRIENFYVSAISLSVDRFR